jgi:hypothetical protein
MPTIRQVNKLILTITVVCFLLVLILELTKAPGLAAPHDRDGNREILKAHELEQVAKLYELEADFHGAASGAGVSQAEKDDHLKDMLALFTYDAILVVGNTTYRGKGEADGPSCEPGSLTVCDFFANHAGSFQLGRNWVALTPPFKTKFEVRGDTADVYFECHYFDVGTGVKESDVSFGLPEQPGSAQARNVDGRWLFSYAVAGFPALSSSY